MLTTTAALPLVKPMELPAGTYVLSDPCYVLDDDRYDELLNATDSFGCDLPSNGGVWVDPLTNKAFAVFSTRYGDGEYMDVQLRRYPVDAGCIACIPIEMVPETLRPSGPEASGHIVEFDRPFSVRERDGIIHFGSVHIDTAEDEPF